MASDKALRFGNLYRLTEDLDALVRTAGESECVTQMERHVRVPHGAIGKGAICQRTLQRLQCTVHISVAHEQHAQAEVCISATEWMLGCFRDTQRFLAHCRTFLEFSEFGQPPGHKAARERRRQDEHAETLANPL